MHVCSAGRWASTLGLPSHACPLLHVLQLHSQREGYVSRAAYKLKEIQKKHHLIKPGGKLLLESNFQLIDAPDRLIKGAHPMTQGGLCLISDAARGHGCRSHARSWARLRKAALSSALTSR